MLRNFLVVALMLLALLAVPIILADFAYLPFIRLSAFDPAAVFGGVLKWPLIAVATIWAAFTFLFLIAAAARRPVWRAQLTALHAFFAKVVTLLGLLLLLAGYSHYIVITLRQYVTDKGGWLAVLPGLLAGIYAAWKNSPLGGGDGKTSEGKGISRLVVKFAPYVFLLTLAVLFSTGIWKLLQILSSPGPPAHTAWEVMFIVAIAAYLFPIVSAAAGPALSPQRIDWDDYRQSGSTFAICTAILGLQWYVHSKGLPNLPVAGVSCLLLAAQIILALGWGIDPNSLSLHSFYRARLVRAYLGASNKSRLNELKKLEEDVTKPDEQDDLALHQLTVWEHGGPFHIINTTLNLVGASDLATEQRLAEVFALSPLHCGSYRTGYRPTKKYVDGSLTLGTALAISGAAASPSMGPKTSVPMGMLMTFFNARLGYWIANPGKHAWKQSWTAAWPYYLVKEFLGQTTNQGKFCYLSDGGHLENLGLYSLIKRRCRYIIVCDASADPNLTFEDLANALRMIRIDFGCEVIGLELKPLAKCQECKGIQYSKEHYAVGTIEYPDGTKGTLIYVKSSLTGDEPPDVLEYHASNSTFPHQSTADQFFNEAQFESYRQLGYHIADAVFEGCGDEANANTTRDIVLQKFNSPARAPTKKGR